MASTNPVSTVFFDLGATLVDAVVNPDRSLKAFIVLPGAREVLQALKKKKIRMGIISDNGSHPPAAVRKALTGAKLLPFFTKKLILLSSEVRIDKTEPAIFRLALDRAGAIDPRECMFVGDDPDERRMARLAGMRTSRSPELAREALDRKPPATLKVPGMKACIAEFEGGLRGPFRRAGRAARLRAAPAAAGGVEAQIAAALSPALRRTVRRAAAGPRRGRLPGGDPARPGACERSRADVRHRPGDPAERRGLRRDRDRCVRRGGKRPL